MMRNQKGIAHLAIIIGIVAVSVIGFAGWRVYESQQNNKDVSNLQEQDSVELQSVLPEDVSDIKPIEEISQVAQTQSSGTALVSVELKDENGVLVYSFTFENGMTYRYNARTGELVSSAQGDKEDGTSIVSSQFSYGITDAIAKAKSMYADKKVSKVEVENEDGTLVYSVRFTDGTRVDISAANGAVVQNREQEEESNSGDDDGQEQNTNRNSSDDEDDDNDEDRSGSNSGSSSSNSDSDDSDDDSDDDDDHGDDEEEDDR